MSNCNAPPQSVPIAIPKTASYPQAGSQKYRPTATTSDPMLKRAGAKAGTKKVPCELRIPISTAAKATMGKKGNMTCVSRTVSSNLPGVFLNSPANMETNGPE